MKLIGKILIVLAVLLFSSCEEIIMHQEPATDNLSIFNEYAKICIEKYGLSEVKNVDVKSLADSIRPFVNNELTQKELFEYLGIITYRLKEGHTYLKVPGTGLRAGYTHFLGYHNADGIMKTQFYYGENVNPTTKHIGSTEYESLRISYGLLPQDTTIGFISIQTFQIDFTRSEIETMLKDLSNTRGLIIDVRTNLGGYVSAATRLASNFITEEIYWAENYIKNGPGENDFAVSKLKLSPSGSKYTYTKPVMLLHNRITFSSGSLFSVMMYSMDHVTTVGQIFGGGTGEIIYGYLANGWMYSLSTSNLKDYLGRPTDNGIEADIPLLIDPVERRHDAIIDRAILEIRKKVGN